MKYCNLNDFTLIPSVYPANIHSQVTIIPRGEQSAFKDGVEYKIEIWPCEQAMDCLSKIKHSVYCVKPHDGRLVFSHLFEGEQLQVIKIIIPEELQYSPDRYYCPPHCGKRPKHPSTRQPVLFAYSVNEDLYSLTVYKGDMHIHSYESDGHEDVAGLIANLRKAGYDYSAVTDHFIYEPSQKAKDVYSGIPDIFTVLSGEEVHVPTEFVHEVSIGASESVNEYYYTHKEQSDREVELLAKSLDIPDGVDPQNYAYRWWIGEKSREFGGMPIITHPYWIWNNVYFVSSAINKLMYEKGNYEAFELLNGGCDRETNSLQVAFYFDEKANGYELPVIGSSDAHVTDRKNDTLPTNAYTLVLAKSRSWEDIHQAVLNNMSVAVEHYEEDENFHVFGSFRLVKYANFLLQNYFPTYMELCQAQGILMKDYACGKSEEDLIMLEQHKKKTDSFTAQFFGRATV